MELENYIKNVMYILVRDGYIDKFKEKALDNLEDTDNKKLILIDLMDKRQIDIWTNRKEMK